LSELEQRIKYAVAKELIEMGYMAGVTVPRCDGGFINVQGKKGEEFVDVEIQVVDAEAVKLRILMEVFNGLSGRDENPVEETNLINELVKTERFTGDQARTYIMKAMQKGQIYGRKAGFYART
jgi:replicative DNA helicase Mcm